MRHLQRPLLEPPIWQALSEQTPLARLREKRTGIRFRKAFTIENFKRTAKVARELSGTQWQEDTYAGLRDLDLTLYCGVVMSVKRHPGRQDVARVQTVLPNLGITDTGDKLVAERLPLPKPTAPAAESAAAEPVAADPAAADPAAFAAKPAGAEPAVPAAEPAAPLSNLPLSQRHQLRSTP